MAHRKVERVEWAKPIDRPNCIPRAKRIRGTKGLGLSFEKKFGKALVRGCPRGLDPLQGQWFQYYADGRLGFCQTDFLLIHPLVVTIIECKLTNVEEATEQLHDLYFPVLEACYRLPVRGIIAVRSLSRLPRAAGTVVCGSLAAALSETSRVPVLHWIGQGPL